ncbi:MAG: aminofutalosine synthase MqnE [Candidatus Magnetoovum sp. WYHC-5]|nr:aminofutalosine synthase MqnE [Candidatus Magnetoovum sp. WYHC-5]
MKAIIDKLNSGHRLEKDDIVYLYGCNDIFSIGQLAESINARLNKNRVYYTVNRHINPTNICVNRCKFCAFSRSENEEGAYELSIEAILRQLSGAVGSDSHLPYKELHIVGGLHPKWPFEYYLELISTIKKTYPYVYIKAFTAVEVDYMSSISGLSLDDVLLKLKNNGLDMMPGGGAEIFSPKTRQRLCPEKISGKRWLEVHERAHLHGIKSNASMLYGHIESFEDRAEHLLMLRNLQDKTGGFLAFIPLAFQPANTELNTHTGSGIDDLKNIAISRLVLDNFNHIKAYWVMLGEKISQTALLFGANDIDGTIVDEKIGHSAGAVSAKALPVSILKHMIEKTNKIAVERDSFYKD